MTWVRASHDDTMRRLSFGEAPKPSAFATQFTGAPSYAQPESAAFAPGAPVRPVNQIVGSPPAQPNNGFGLMKTPNEPMKPIHQAEQGWGNVTRAQAEYLSATQYPSEAVQRLPLAAFNWEQSRPSVTDGLPQWANDALNQSAYNTGNKEMTSVPRYAQGYDDVYRYDTQMQFPTQSRELSRHYNIPSYARGPNWWGVVDTSRPGWTNPNAARYEYRPDPGFGLGEFLMAAAPLIGGAMFGPGILGGLGNLGTAASNAASIASNVRD